MKETVNRYSRLKALEYSSKSSVSAFALPAKSPASTTKPRHPIGNKEQKGCEYCVYQRNNRGESQQPTDTFFVANRKHLHVHTWTFLMCCFGYLHRSLRSFLFVVLLTHHWIDLAYLGEFLTQEFYVCKLDGTEKVTPHG